MARKHKFIDSIFNYCDAWCERCPFTQRCRLFAMQKQMERLIEREDRENAAFWKAMEMTLGDALKDVAAQEQTLAPEPQETTSGRRFPEHPKERAMKNHSVSLASLQYARAVESWFRRHKKLPDETSAVADAVQVIRWYEHFIHVKFCRALSWFPEYDEFADQDSENDAGEEWKGQEPSWAQDSNGSAKIAIIAIERSISAWSTMREHYPDEREQIMKMMTQLARVRSLADQIFPKARQFHRPGFDDAPQA